MSGYKTPEKCKGCVWLSKQTDVPYCPLPRCIAKDVTHKQINREDIGENNGKGIRRGVL